MKHKDISSSLDNNQGRNPWLSDIHRDVIMNALEWYKYTTQ